jgi:hypothetical protein
MFKKLPPLHFQMWKRIRIVSTVKLGYNKQLLTGQICCYYQNFVTTGVVYVVNKDFELKKWRNQVLTKPSLL